MSQPLLHRPEFTHEERYVIEYYNSRESRHLGNAVWADAGFLLPCCAFIGLGLYNDSVVVITIGFLILLLFKIRETWTSIKFAHLFSSIFRKYESSFTRIENSASDAGA